MIIALILTVAVALFAVSFLLGAFYAARCLGQSYRDKVVRFGASLDREFNDDEDRLLRVLFGDNL